MALNSKSSHHEIAYVEQCPTHVLGFLSQAFWKTKIFLISCFAVCILKRRKLKLDGDVFLMTVTVLLSHYENLLYLQPLESQQELALGSCISFLCNTPLALMCCALALNSWFHTFHFLSILCISCT